MKRLVIILALAIMVFTMPNRDIEQPTTTALGMPQTAATELTEAIPARDTETADVSKTEEILVEIKETTETNNEPIPTEDKVETKAKSAVQETSMKECTEETEDLKVAESEEIVKCVDEGDQSLADYKPQIGLQPNPFENDTITEIIDRPVEDYIGEGEDRPGEGMQF